jgi:hypothetical protein
VITTYPLLPSAPTLALLSVVAATVLSRWHWAMSGQQQASSMLAQPLPHLMSITSLDGGRGLHICVAL